jgi:anti-anti-sigma factor
VLETPQNPLQPFSCDVTYVDEHAVATVRGEIDIATAPRLLREVLATLALPINHVTIDLGAVTFIDSSGLAALARAHNDAEARGIRLILESVPDQARRVLDLTDLAQLFDIREG